MSKIKCFNCGDFGPYACDCPKAHDNANIAQESEQNKELENMMDLDNSSVGEEYVMSCQFEPLLFCDKVELIKFLVCRSVLFDGDVHIVPETDEVLDCDALEIYHRSITFCIFLNVFIISGVQGELKVGWIIKFMVGPISGAFGIFLTSRNSP